MNSNRNYRPYPTGALHNAIRDALWEVQRNLQAPDALIAAIFHHFTGQDGDVISMETLQRALDVVGWYFDEFVHLLGDRNDEPQEQKDVRTLGMYLHSRYWANGYNTAMRNEVRKCGPIRHQGRFEAALQRLCWDGSVFVRYDNMLKRKGRLWIDLNPAAFNQIGMQ